MREYIEAASKLFETAPPGRKAEEFITHNKKEFQHRYGKDWESYLYGTAWKKFGKKKRRKKTHESTDLRAYLARLDADPLN